MAIQIIQENRKPSSFDKFSQLAGQGAELATQNLMSREKKNAQELQNRKENTQLKKLGFDVEGLTPELKKEVVSRMLQGKQQEELQTQKYDREDQLAGLKPKAAADLKFEKEVSDEKQIKQTGQDAFNGLANLLKKNNVGFGSGFISSLPFGTETQKDVGEFTSLTGGLEAMLVDMVSRGTLSNTRFQYITENLLPKSNDRHETIKGKLLGLSQILGLDPSALIGGESLSEENPQETSPSKQPKKTLDIESMKKLYELSGGDKAKAKQIAKKMGYDVQ